MKTLEKKLWQKESIVPKFKAVKTFMEVRSVLAKGEEHKHFHHKKSDHNH